MAVELQAIAAKYEAISGHLRQLSFCVGFYFLVIVIWKSSPTVSFLQREIFWKFLKS